MAAIPLPIALRDSEALARLSTSEIARAATALRGWGCCPRCVLRFLGEKEAHVYRCLEEGELRDWLNLLAAARDHPIKSEEASDAAPTPLTADPVCTACLGVLQALFNSNVFLEGVQSSVAALNFEFTTFLCSVSLPVSLLPRDHSIYLLVRDLVPELYGEGGARGGGKHSGVAAVKDVWKWINGPLMAAKLKVNFDQNSLFEVVLSFVHEDSVRECLFLHDVFPDVFRRRKGRQGELYTRTNVSKALDDMSEVTFRKSYSCPPRIPRRAVTCEPVRCETRALYVAGRYNKLSRALSQTPWLIDGQRKTASSIEELISLPLNEVVRASTTKFSASGREDVDVRMLGTGRPFVVEFTNPRRVTFTPADLAGLQREINARTMDIGVRDLQLVTKEDTGVLKEGEEEKTKRYSALCWTRDALSAAELQVKLAAVAAPLTLQQKTPLRVLHRRPLATRPRDVHVLSVARVVDTHHFVLALATQAGTYVKEFVHGDFGRTTPSLTQILGTECDILELDVEAVELDWPPSLEVVAARE